MRCVNESIRIPEPQCLYRNEGPSKHQDPILPNDGSLNVILLFFKEEPLECSAISCVGDNFQSDAHLYQVSRSCHFQNVCWDMERHDLVLVPSLGKRQWLDSISRDSLFTSAVDTNVSVLLGGVNIKWGELPADRLK